MLLQKWPSFFAGIATKSSKIVRFVHYDGFKIGRICDIQKAQIFCIWAIPSPAKIPKKFSSLPPSFVVYTLKKTAFRVNYEQHEPTKRAKSVQLKKYPYVVFYIATAEGLFINCVDRILTPSPIVNNFTT